MSLPTTRWAKPMRQPLANGLAIRWAASIAHLSVPLSKSRSQFAHQRPPESFRVKFEMQVGATGCGKPWSVQAYSRTLGFSALAEQGASSVALGLRPPRAAIARRQCYGARSKERPEQLSYRILQVATHRRTLAPSTIGGIKSQVNRSAKRPTWRAMWHRRTALLGRSVPLSAHRSCSLTWSFESLVNSPV